MEPLQAIWETLKQLHKPVDYDTALQSGMTASQAAGRNPQQFKDWFEKEHRHLLDMLNGQ